MADRMGQADQAMQSGDGRNFEEPAEEFVSSGAWMGKKDVDKIFQSPPDDLHALCKKVRLVSSPASLRTDVLVIAIVFNQMVSTCTSMLVTSRLGRTNLLEQQALPVLGIAMFQACFELRQATPVFCHQPAS